MEFLNLRLNFWWLLLGDYIVFTKIKVYKTRNEKVKKNQMKNN